MSIKHIKTFIDWCQKGDESLKDRLEMFLARRKALQSQIKEIMLLFIITLREHKVNATHKIRNEE